MNQVTEYWNEALKIIEEESSSLVSFETWIMPLVPLEIEGNNFILKIGDSFYKEMIEKRYMSLIKNSIKKITSKEYNVIIFTEDELKEKNNPTKSSHKKSVNTVESVGNLNPRYVFSSFVVGNSNRMAHAASLAVAESPAGAYNPLFLYGGVGLGKTHLMHSIAHYILEHNPDKKVLYASSETFTNELINSIKNNKNEEFRNKYRNIDVLLIDDIQFISQKESTQEEFFHTFNTLHESNKQIIISSDRPPKEIKTLEDRLRSRFEWGLIADIQPPDYETRIAILQKKADTDGLTVPNEVMAFIAKCIVSNIRELEGALTRIVAYASLTNQQITIELAENALKDIFSDKTTTQITPELIQEVVANYYNIRTEDITGSKKPKNIAYPRQIAMYLSRKILDISLPKIGERFGGRDHSTVIHACTKIEKELEKDPSLQKTILELEKRIKGQ
ncbi:chromosomal replication initiation protein DnaA [Tyzzerella sp. An114]|uniref:chromosomal replication initiator protein DnaA n=1 Tax=Tyzzerella sp. An114 TaxID=1965545 RepID=UPI000B44E222|nr:chromosomal replication initiator protein DnaA [Tyzzerella sp. An114]OUQ59084.1 chromosomal replication initiation protein DnaA [Tyzzerella sp. An114]HIT73466.1 chromosomal replication initiator protein DnaA [Candidatus Fimicola cottocaccae]